MAGDVFPLTGNIYAGNGIIRTKKDSNKHRCMILSNLVL